MEAKYEIWRAIRTRTDVSTKYTILVDSNNYHNAKKIKSET
jgi:hypothetical protein